MSAFCRSRLLGRYEARKGLERCGVQRCYTDPQLRVPNVFQGFVKRLSEAGLVEFSLTEGIEQVEMFCVAKKDGRQRLVVDCRRSNCWFSLPGKVRLATAECLSRIQLTGESPLYISTADLKDAFYHFELPVELRDFFSTRPVPAGAVGIEHLEGCPVAPGVWVRPRLRVLPMGWSHALWWCRFTSALLVASEPLNRTVWRTRQS